MVTLNIAYTFDQNYIMQTGVSIYSLLSNNDGKNIHFYLIHPKNMPEDIENLHRTIQSFDSTFSTLYTDDFDALLDELNVPTYYGNRTVYYRLFLANVLPQIDRLLFLDGDTIIKDDISPLYRTDLEGNVLGMCYDSNSLEVKCAFGMDADDHYFNAGVILYDLEKYRTIFDIDKTIEAIRTVCAESIMPDQDLINLQFRGQIKTLDLRHNYQPIHILFDSDVYLNYFKTGYYSKEELDDAYNHSVILHSLRIFGDRPWDYNSLHPHQKIFCEYKNRTLWSEYTIQKKKKKTVHIIEYNLYKILPKKLFFYIFYKIHKYSILQTINKSKASEK